MIDGNRSGRARKGFSTAQVLSLLTTTVVVSVLSVGIVITGVTLTRTALSTAQDRLTRTVRQLASVTASNVRALQPRYATIAGDSAIGRVLAAAAGKPDAGAVERAQTVLNRLRATTDSGMPIELWNSSGRRIAYTGNNIPDSISLLVKHEGDSVSQQFRPGLESIHGGDSLQLGQLYHSSGRTFFWTAMPVVRDHRTVGFILQQRRIAAGPQTEQTIRELSGDSVSGYYRNSDASVWTTFGGAASTSPVIATTDSARFRPAGRPLMFAEQRVAGTPLVIGMELPRSSATRAAWSQIRTLGYVSIVLTFVAGFAAWIIGRRVASPLTRIAGATDDLARGNYGVRVPMTGTFEISRLAGNFNRMATELGESRSQLERSEEEMRAVAQEAVAANRAKSDFLAAMSHELRTPLNAIGGYAELIEMGIRGPVTDQQRQDLSRIRTSQQHLLALIGGVLDLARIESGRVQYSLEKVALESLLASLEALVAPQARAKQHTLTLRPPKVPLNVVADSDKLRQILLNLLSNAIRHTPPGTEITVFARPGAPGMAEIIVQDTGPGIAREQRHSVFEPFVQLDRSLSNPAEGIGLGLAISRDLARGMNGDLTIDGDGRTGARFVIVLPAA